MEFITNNLPLLIPIFLIQLALIIFALADLVRRENTRGPKWVWVLVILFVNMIGPIVYFLLGRDEA
ncbi:MAG: PLDc_N domain-containing protein [Anaerolineales bacterium]|nr:PLDc_N domain-containing protein [Anaerolineales bacterium]